jgi:uncharacterized protein (UPF0332 family)
MSHEKNKLEWCLKKAQREIEEGKKHRGLIKINPNINRAKTHIAKAEHNLKAITYFNEGGFSDWSMSAVFYCIYHCFLAIANKFGYESRNQECTIALMKVLITEGKISLDPNFVKALEALDEKEKQESNVIDKREFYTYETASSLINPDEIEEGIRLCKESINQTKNIVFNE